MLFRSISPDMPYYVDMLNIHDVIKMLRESDKYRICIRLNNIKINTINKYYKKDYSEYGIHKDNNIFLLDKIINKDYKGYYFTVVKNNNSIVLLFTNGTNDVKFNDCTIADSKLHDSDIIFMNGLYQTCRYFY